MTDIDAIAELNKRRQLLEARERELESSLAARQERLRRECDEFFRLGHEELGRKTAEAEARLKQREDVVASKERWVKMEEERMAQLKRDAIARLGLVPTA